MASDESDFKYQGLQDREGIAKYLNALAEGINQGQLVLRSGDREYVLEPNNLVELHIESKHRKDRAKLTVKLEWKNGESERTDSLQIRTGSAE